MGFRKAVLSTGDGFLDRVLCVLGALAFSQAPEFMQQYLQRLGGHVDEARRQVSQFRQAAQQSGVTLDQLITQTNATANPAVAKLGAVMSDSTARLATLESSQAAIAQASVFERPFVFLKNVDANIAQATWNIYKPALPTTAEGAIYAVVGMMILLCLYHLLFRYPVRAGYRTWKRRRVENTIARA